MRHVLVTRPRMAATVALLAVASIVAPTLDGASARSGGVRRGECQSQKPVEASRLSRGVSCQQALVRLSPGRTYEIMATGSLKVATFGAASLVVDRERPVAFRASSAALVVLSHGHGLWRLRHFSSSVLPPGDSESPVRPKCHGSPPTLRRGVLKTELAVYGDGASALGAAVSAARHCVPVALLSPDGGVGGMLSSGQIGVTDSNPSFDWQDTPVSGPVGNGKLVESTAWSTAGGLLGEFRARLARLQPAPHSLEESLRYEPKQGVSVVNQLLRSSAPMLRIFRNTTISGATMAGKHVADIDTVGGMKGRVIARYWIDGSDAGELIGALKLPYKLGVETPADPAGDGDVMAYAYRWTAIESATGIFPAQAPEYYALNKANFDAQLPALWSAYVQPAGISPNASYAVQPFRLLSPRGRISGGPTDALAEPLTGLVPPGRPPEKWDVNNGLNDLETTLITEDLRANPSVPGLFARNHIPDPYTSAPFNPAWADVPFIEDETRLSSTDRTQLVGLVEDAVKARALGLLYYIRSGDMQTRLRELPGGTGVTVRSNWSVDNQLGTRDGLPPLMYQREGRRVVADYTETIHDLCPTQPAVVGFTYGCTAPPRYLGDAIAVGDSPADDRETGLTSPTVEKLQAPYQVSFHSLIPQGSTGLLVGSAIGVDRLAFGALRTDPLRLMVGDALGDAVALAAKSKVTNFQSLNMMGLRDMLADDYQPTSFVPWVPTTSVAGSWKDLELARTMQILLDHDWLSTAESGLVDPSKVASPGLPLTGPLAERLRASRTGDSCVSRRLGGQANGVVTMSKLLGMSQPGTASVGDAYTLLAWCML
jgi:hypothetical protein